MVMNTMNSNKTQEYIVAPKQCCNDHGHGMHDPGLANTVISIVAGEVSCWACSGAFMSCTGMPSDGVTALNPYNQIHVSSPACLASSSHPFTCCIFSPPQDTSHQFWWPEMNKVTRVTPGRKTSLLSMICSFNLTAFPHYVQSPFWVILWMFGGKIEYGATYLLTLL